MPIYITTSYGNGGDDLYVILTTLDGVVWNGSTLEEFDEDHLEAYGVVLDDEGDGRYQRAFPISAPSNTYIITLYRQDESVLTMDDANLGFTQYAWPGYSPSVGAGYLNHTPAEILAEYVVSSLELMSNPDDGSGWPLYVSYLPNATVNCGAVYDTVGITETRDMNGGIAHHFGIQVRIIGNEYASTWALINSIADRFSVTHNVLVVMDENPSYEYRIGSIIRTSSIISMGTMSTTVKYDFVANFNVTLYSI